ncbi:hypothetical protein BJ912DRAFT_979538, partial [Pholiota molesta]
HLARKQVQIVQVRNLNLSLNGRRTDARGVGAVGRGRGREEKGEQDCQKRIFLMPACAGTRRLTQLHSFSRKMLELGSNIPQWHSHTRRVNTDRMNLFHWQIHTKSPCITHISSILIIISKTRHVSCSILSHPLLCTLSARPHPLLATPAALKMSILGKISASPPKIARMKSPLARFMFF